MEGNERITLYEPTTLNKDARGRPVRGDAKQHPLWARRQDRGGREAVFGDARAGNWSVRFEIRNYPSIEDISANWYLADGRGRGYDIEAVSVAPADGRERRWWIYAVRRET